MQVSWIDPDEVRDLLKQLEGPKQSSTASAWEVHTLPSAPVAPPAYDSLMAEGAAPPLDPAPEDHPLAEVRTGPANAELWRIRERLRVLRDKAQTAGIFSRTRQEEPAQAAPEPEPAASPETPSADSAPEAVAAEPEPEPPAQPVSETAPEPAPTAQDEADQPAIIAPIQDPSVLPSATIPIESPFELVESPPPVYEPLFSPAPAPAAAQAVEIPEAAPESVAEASATPEKEDTPFVVSNVGLSERLNAVAEWVCTRLNTREVLLVDDYGDVLWGAQGQTALVLSAMMAWHSAQRASASATCIDPERIDKPLPPDRSLTVLPLRTRYGVVSLAVIQANPVAEADAAAIRRALTLAVEGLAHTGNNEGA